MQIKTSDQSTEIIHEIPFPWGARLVFIAMGAFAIIVSTWELWRGVWPINFTSPFFAFLILGAWSIGFAVLGAGLRGASATLVFQHGELEVREAFLRSSRTRRFAVAELVQITTVVLPDSDGPDRWEVEIKTKHGDRFSSRPFDTEKTARKWEGEFRRVLGVE